MPGVKEKTEIKFMRELKPEEARKVEQRLRKYVGNNLDSVFNPTYVLVLQGPRVFYARRDLCNKASPIPRDAIVSVGMCIGRFTKSGRFVLKITALPLLATYATDRVCVKASAEMHFVYGNHIQKTHLHRIDPETVKNAGVVVLSPNNIPLGFGVTSKAGTEVVSGDNTAIVVLRHGDTGEYLREEQSVM
jgi:60S ribosome subunit biogenesis protein NIP7